MFLDGRPPVDLGVTSGGDFFGGTQISFTDVLGDQQFNLFAASVSQYRTMSLSYLNLERRMQWAVQGYSQTQFFYGQYEGLFYDPAFSRPDRSRSRRGDAHDARRHGVRDLPVQPLPPRRDVRRPGRLSRAVRRPGPRGLLAGVSAGELRAGALQQRHHGAARRHVHPGDDGLPRVRSARRQHDAGQLRGRAEDRRHASRARPSTSTPASTSGSAAAACSRCAARGFKSWGDNPGFLYFGGNSEMRGYDYLSFVGQDAFHLNAELRFPLIEAMATPIGILGGIRGTFFANIGGARLRRRRRSRSGRTTRRSRRRSSDYRAGRPGARADLRPAARRSTASGWSTPAPHTASASRPSRSASRSTSTGRGRRCSTSDWEDVVFAQAGGSSAFRKPKFTMWIGYDF